MKKTLIMLCAAILGAACAPKGPQAIPTDKEVEAKVEKVLKGMTLEEKAGQLVQLNISVLEDETHEAIDPAKLDRIIGQYKVGSILNVMHDRGHSREHTAAMVRQIQEKSMEAIGIHCLLAKNGREALDILKDMSTKGPMDEQLLMVISDIEMPEMDGYTLTASIRNDPALKDLEVILHTSLSGIFNQTMVKKVGANNFIAKFNPDELAKAVRDVLKSKQGQAVAQRLS